MPSRPLGTPSTRLGAAIRERRGALKQHEAATEVDIEPSTFSRLEAGKSKPTAETAVKLAAWLGWSVAEVVEKAKPEKKPEGA
jgi:DNA-binding XRE family transcriptional regulator